MSMATSSSVGWVVGWTRARSGMELRALVPNGLRWAEVPVLRDFLLTSRSFEPSLSPFKRLVGSNLKFDIGDMSNLSALIEPGRFIGHILPAARRSEHAVYIVDTAQGPIYVPAMLLIRALWYWSKRAGSILMTPNGLDIHVSAAKDKGDFIECSASRTLASSQPSDLLLRRLAWLSLCDDARRSWTSVLRHAHQGRLGLTLPKASIQGWAWGVEIHGGLLAAELMSVDIRFELPTTPLRLRIGTAIYDVPTWMPQVASDVHHAASQLQFRGGANG